MSHSYLTTLNNSLQRRCNLTPVSNVCEASAYILVQVPKRFHELPEVRFDWQIDNAFFYKRPIMARTQVLVHI